MKQPKPLQVAHEHPDTKRTIREEAEFMALEIFEDRLAPRVEIADAIEIAISRYAMNKYLLPR